MLSGRIRHQVVEHDDEAAVLADGVEQPFDVRAVTGAFVVAEPARLDRAPRDTAAGGAIGDGCPGILEPADILVAGEDQPFVERGEQGHRIAHADDEARARPQLQRGLELLGCVEVGDRAVGSDRLPRLRSAEEMIEIAVLDPISQRLIVEPAKVMLAEEMRLLDEWEEDLRMALQPARHGRRPAAGGADDEQEPLDVLDTRHLARP